MGMTINSYTHTHNYLTYSILKQNQRKKKEKNSNKKSQKNSNRKPTSSDIIYNPYTTDMTINNYTNTPPYTYYSEIEL